LVPQGVSVHQVKGTSEVNEYGGYVFLLSSSDFLNPAYAVDEISSPSLWEKTSLGLREYLLGKTF
jgi:hypothetical protein